MYRFTTTIMIFGLGLSSQLAQAAPPQDVHFVDVHFADLDLTRSEGAAVLYQRLKGCVETAIGSAVAQVARPILTAYYKEHTDNRNAAIQIAKNQN